MSVGAIETAKLLAIRVDESKIQWESYLGNIAGLATAARECKDRRRSLRRRQKPFEMDSNARVHVRAVRPHSPVRSN